MQTDSNSEPFWTLEDIHEARRTMCSGATLARLAHTARRSFGRLMLRSIMAFFAVGSLVPLAAWILTERRPSSEMIALGLAPGCVCLAFCALVGASLILGPIWMVHRTLRSVEARVRAGERVARSASTIAPRHRRKR